MVESGQQREMFPYQMGNIVDSRISINAPFLHSFLRRPTEAWELPRHGGGVCIGSYMLYGGLLGCREVVLDVVGFVPRAWSVYVYCPTTRSSLPSFNATDCCYRCLNQFTVHQSMEVARVGETTFPVLKTIHTVPMSSNAEFKRQEWTPLSVRHLHNCCTPLAFSVRFWAVVVLWSLPGVKVEQGLVLWWVLLCERICQSHRLESWVTPHTSDKSNMTQKWPQAHWLFNGSLECRHCQSLACLQKESENTVSCKQV